MKLSLILSLLLVSSFASAHSFEPGKWKAESDVTVNGIPLPGSEDEECVSKKEAKDVKATIAKKLEKNGCVLTKWKIKKEQLDASLKCKTDSLDAVGDLKGTISKKNYDLTGEAKGTFKSINTTAVVELKGEWLSKCE